jgi:hypothetical protein
MRPRQVCLFANTLGVFFACLLGSPIPVAAIDPGHTLFQYAAKFLCTANVPGTSQTTPSLAPGTYYTAVNIHNPYSKEAQLRKKIAVVVPPGGQKPGEISAWIVEKLQPDQAINVSCDEITRTFGITFIHGAEGYLVIESTGKLDVTGVYTVEQFTGASGRGPVSIDVERIPERKLIIDEVVCTLDTKQCPDGSFVGRVPPFCEFAPCPGE